jgi:ribosomal silencing factor RsfS
LDFFDVIVHVMHTEVRHHYDLEGLWGDARPMKAVRATKTGKKKPAAKK